MEDRFVYRLATPEKWEQTQAQGWLAKTPLDERDGFIHLSTAGQIIQTANLHFSDHESLYALLFERRPLEDKLKWEAGEGRWDKMPHYYGELALAVVQKTLELKRNPGGSFGIVTEGAL